MSKKLIFISLISILVLSSSVVFAVSTASSGSQGYTNNYGYGCRGSYRAIGYSLMKDQNGNFVDKDEFENNLDEAIEEGTILASDRDFYLNMYDYCISNYSDYNYDGNYGYNQRGMMNGGYGMMGRW